MELLFLYLFIAIGFSFLCSLLEASFLSTKESYILTLKEQGVASATIFEDLLKDKSNSISSILTVNTFAHTLGAAGVGAEAVRIFGEGYMFVISAVLTLVILVFSEIIPKTIGATYWKSLFGFTAKTLFIMNKITYFSNKFLTLFTRFLKEPEEVTTKEEVITNARMSFKDGILDENEVNVITNVLKLKSIVTDKIMTPRKVVFSLSEDAKVEDVLKTIEENDSHTRILLHKEDKDDIDSYVLKSDILRAEPQTKIKDLEKSILTVSNKDNASFVFNKFLTSKEHIFLVLDEYKQVDGIVTLEDVFESLLGVEIMDETDEVEDLGKLAKTI